MLTAPCSNYEVSIARWQYGKVGNVAAVQIQGSQCLCFMPSVPGICFGFTVTLTIIK